MSRSQDTRNQQASTNYKEAFSLFDKRGNGRVALESLGDLLRACGQNPTLAEIRDLEGSVGGDCRFSPVSLACFIEGGKKPPRLSEKRRRAVLKKSGESWTVC